MSHKQLFVTLPAVSLLLSGFTRAFAQESSGNGLGWILVLIALILLIPLVLWLKRTSGPAADQGREADAHAPIQATYPLESDAINPAPIAPAPVKVEEVAAETKEVVQNIADQIAETAAEGEDEGLPVTPDAEEPGQSFVAAAGQSQATSRAPSAIKPDDLTLIEGIGPKISHILHDNGISTFAQLATIETDRIKQILQEAGLSNIANPATWPEQAQLAADGNWEALKTLQDGLKAGRRT